MARSTVTITDTPDHTAEVEASELLFPEARRRRRRRWLISGTAAVAILVVVGMVIGLLAASSGPAGPSRPLADPAPTTSAAASADAAFSIRPVLCYAPPYALGPGRTPPTGPLATCSASTALTASNLRVVPDSANVNGYTYSGNDLGPDPQFASDPSTAPSNNGPDQEVLLPGAPGQGSSRYVLGPVGLDRRAIAHARVTQEGGQWAVDIVLTRRGSAQWDSFVRRTFHAISGVVINGRVVSAPIMQPTQSVPTSFYGQLQISGDFTQHQAQRIAARL